MIKKLFLILSTLAAAVSAPAQNQPQIHVEGKDIVNENSNAPLQVYRGPSAQAIKMYETLYNAGIEAELILNDRAPHGNLGREAAAAIQSFISRILIK